MRMAILDARVMAWEGEANASGDERSRFVAIAALMDATHNIPGFLPDLGHWDDSTFERLLESVDSRHGGRLGGHLWKLYREKLGKLGSPEMGE